jgi:3',5'-cyclic AMP phosphodiesterase CpdA
LNDPPKLILNGGDAIMDCFATDAARTKLQWDLWKRLLRDDCSTPVKHCIGNHDIWGWDKARSGTTGNEDLWGKKRAIHELEIPERYYSFDESGWHFVVLDSVHPRGDGYHGGLDEDQFDWLKRDLKATPSATPVLVLSHISIISVAAIQEVASDDLQQVHVSTGVIFRDFRRVMDLFREHPNVKLCLSGHMHMLDRLEFRGATYICGGAVSGNWWKGDRAGFDEGYGVVDLYKDGSFEYQYVAYGWTPRA